jgi:hypothetical protein
MTSRNADAITAESAKPSFKQRFKHEMKDYAIISIYLAILFCAVMTYTMLLLRKYDADAPVNYGFAIFNALVIGKVILIGEMMHLGRRVEHLPIYQSVILKSLIFGLFLFAFHILEEFIKRVYHGKPAGTVLHEMEWEQLLARSIVIFCAFLPLFAFRELRRVLGGDKLTEIFLHPPKS